MLDGHTLRREILAKCYVVIPSREVLLFLKLKAARDRSFRLKTGASFNPEWDRAKLEKDHADILALLDPAAGLENLDLMLPGDLLHRYPFLLGVIQSIPGQIEGIHMYARMTDEEVKEMVDRLLQLIA